MLSRLELKILFERPHAFNFQILLDNLRAENIHIKSKPVTERIGSYFKRVVIFKTYEDNYNHDCAERACKIIRDFIKEYPDCLMSYSLEKIQLVGHYNFSRRKLL